MSAPSKPAGAARETPAKRSKRTGVNFMMDFEYVILSGLSGRVGVGQGWARHIYTASEGKFFKTDRGVFDDPSLGFASKSELESFGFLGGDLIFCHGKPAPPPPPSDRQMPLSASARTARFHLGHSVKTPVSLTQWLCI